MEHRTTPLLLLVWLLLLAMAGAVWLFLAGAPPTEFAPGARCAVERVVDRPAAPAEATWALTGRVRGADGRPLEGVAVDVDGHRVESGTDGRFEVAGLSWRDHDVAFWKEGHGLMAVNFAVPSCLA